MGDFYELFDRWNFATGGGGRRRTEGRPRSPLTMEQRLLRIRDNLLALMHAYYMPLLIADWITYKIGSRIEIGFYAHSYNMENAPYLQLGLSVSVDYNRYFDIKWDEDGTLEIEKTRNIAVHERLFNDILMLKQTVTIKDKTNVASKALRLGSLGRDAWTKKRIARMRRLRNAAELHARSQEEAHYLMRDLKRAEAWGGIAEAIRFGAAHPVTAPRVH